MLRTTFIFATIVLAVALAAHSGQRNDNHKHHKQQLGQHYAHSLENLKHSVHPEHSKHVKAEGRFTEIKHNAKHSVSKRKGKSSSHKRHNRTPLYGNDKEQHKHQKQHPHEHSRKHQQKRHTGARHHY